MSRMDFHSQTYPKFANKAANVDERVVFFLKARIWGENDERRYCEL